MEPGREGQKEGADVRSVENVPIARENVTRKAVAAKSRQEGSTVTIEDSVAPASETAAGATLADVRSAQITGDVGSQRSARSADVHHEEEDEEGVAAPGLEGQRSLVVANAVIVAVSAQTSVDGMAKEERMIEKLKEENLTHEELIAEKTAYALALLYDVNLQQFMKNFVKQREKNAQLLVAERAKLEISAMVEQLKRNVLTVTMTAGE